jgi:hypothetical protein
VRYQQFTKDEWGRLPRLTPLTLTEADLTELQGINERVSLEEVTLVYLPLSRLLNLYVAATQRLRQTTDTFLGKLPAPISYVIANCGKRCRGQEHRGPRDPGVAVAVAESSESRSRHDRWIPLSEQRSSSPRSDEPQRLSGKL